MAMFINFSNHPSHLWSAAQRAAAGEYGEIRDLPFPLVDPSGDEDYIKALTDEYVVKILEYKPSAVLCQGEMTLAFAVSSMLISRYGVTVLAACSERAVTESVDEHGAAAKLAGFKFTRFRKYLP